MLDLRARMMLTSAEPIQSTAVLDLVGVPTTTEYPGASENELQVFSYAFEAARRIVESGGTDEDLDRAAVLLSWCDAAYRAGPSTVAKGHLSHLLADAHRGDEVAARVPDDLLADVAAMRTIGRAQLQQWTTAISRGDRFTPNPRLAGRDIVVGAVPDWLIGSTLIECKTSDPVTPSKLRDALLQLLGYVLLDLDDAHHIREVAIWLPRRGTLRTWTIDQLLDTEAEAELPRLRGEFRMLFEEYLRDWHDDEWVPGTIHPAGGYDEYVGEAYMHEWFRNGRLHREDGPAIHSGSARWWYLDGELQRAILDGAQLWYHHDQLHREDGPAVIEANRTQLWYRDGKLHREDGPAIVWKDGTHEWWLRGCQYDTEAGWERAKAIGLTLP